MKKLLENFQRKWPTYLFEVIVLIVGIYGALAVENWNEERKESVKVATLMTNLQRDFMLRKEELNEFKTVRNDALAAIDRLYVAISNRDGDLSKESLDTCIMQISNAMTFNDQFKMLEVLFSSGMINDLKNEELKQRLLLWPQQVEEMMEEQRNRVYLRNSFFELMLFEYVALREIYELVSFRGYGSPQRLQPVTFKSDYDGLLSNPSFERYLAELESLLRVNAIDSEILLDNATQILNLLALELKK